jgi:hypothetical protein
LVPSRTTTGGSKTTVTNSKVQIIVPSQVVNAPVTTPPREAPFTLQFNALAGPVDVELNAKTPQDVATFLDYVESGAFNDELFHRLALDTISCGTTPAVSQATVNTNGSLTLTGGTAVTLLPAKLMRPSTLMFQFDTSAGTAEVRLGDTKTPLTATAFMVAIESSALDAAVLQRLTTGCSLPTSLHASVTNGCINLTGGNIGSSETIVMSDGTIVSVPPAMQPAWGNPVFQFKTPSGAVDVTISNDATAQTAAKFTNYLESPRYVGSDLQIQVYSAASQPTVSSALVARSSNLNLPLLIRGVPASNTRGGNTANIGSGASGGGTAERPVPAPSSSPMTRSIPSGNKQIFSSPTTAVSSPLGGTIIREIAPS